MYRGHLPRVGDAPVARVRSGGAITVDTVSHERVLQDRGRDPAAWSGGCAHLPAAVDLTVSQVVDRTVGGHGTIPRSPFR